MLCAETAFAENQKSAQGWVSRQSRVLCNPRDRSQYSGPCGFLCFLSERGSSSGQQPMNCRLPFSSVFGSSFRVHHMWGHRGVGPSGSKPWRLHMVTKVKVTVKSALVTVCGPGSGGHTPEEVTRCADALNTVRNKGRVSVVFVGPLQPRKSVWLLAPGADLMPPVGSPGVGIPCSVGGPDGSSVTLHAALSGADLPTGCVTLATHPHT